MNIRVSLLSLAMVSFSAFAQSAREEMAKNPLLCGGNHTAYIVPEQKLTPAPKGYEPFYIDHYARHGSRWLLSDDEYMGPIRTLRAADQAGVLTPLAKDILAKLEAFYPCTVRRLGDLTTVGERQHHGIGKRMTQNFPEVFRGKTAEVDARSTVVPRCILSMIAECEEITAYNPNIKIHNDVSESLQWYLNHDWDGKVRQSSRKAAGIVDAYKKKLTHPERFCRTLFTDESYWRDEDFRARSFMRAMFKLADNMQSHDNGFDMLSLFTEEEIYDQWRIKNIDWYLYYGPSPVTDGNMPFNQRFLLRNMIETADTVLASKTYTNGASLRFGHEVCVMPLACLMEFDSCGVQVADLDRLDEKWVCYRIYPMACNIQWIFYRPKKGNGDILVKALLNEKEATMPIKTDQFPYYKWEDVRRYYLDKLNAYGE